MTDTPIKRGTAKRLGLDLPRDTAIYDEIDWSRVPTGKDFADAMERMQRTMATAMRTRFLFPTHMGRPGDVR
jgi:hypothetical protein